MALQKMHNTGIVVDDLDAAIAFFAELGMVLEGRMDIEGSWADLAVGIDGIRSEIAMMRTPDGEGRLELAKYHRPGLVDALPENPPHNILGMHRVMYAVDDLDDTIARLRKHGGDVIGGIGVYEDSIRICYFRGPAGIIVGLSDTIG
ncbi:VOC family protein [Kribbella sp. NPDC026611]|uniref:VOC family protein n=1 Tax=Kribbella sp. NPDC026611 TaxID=3154911 RepID=UPI00340CDDDF